MSLNYLSKFTLYSPLNKIVIGTVECQNKKNKSSGSIPKCKYTSGQLCSKDGTHYHVGAYSNRSLIDNATIFMFEPTSTVKDGTFVYYGDYVRIVSLYSSLNKKYYMTTNECDTDYAIKLEPNDDPNYQTFKITVPPGLPNQDGNPVYNNSMIALKMETYDSKWNDTYIFYDTGTFFNTNGWVWQYKANFEKAQQCVWSIVSTFNPGGCNRPDPSDVNMFHADDTQYGDKNYGEVKRECKNTIQGPPSPPDGMKKYKIDDKDSACGMGVCVGDFSSVCDLFGDKTSLFPGAACGALSPCKCGSWTGCPTTHWAFINEWKTQTETPKNQIMCCGGLWSSSDECHPYYCPFNPNKFNFSDNDGGSCPEIMNNACTSSNWSLQYTDPSSSNAYIGKACDSYIANGDSASAKDVATNAVKDFYSSHKPTDDHPFVRKAIDLCNKYPGACDDTLKSVCSVYTPDDLDTKNWSGRKWDAEGTNLIDTCGCFMNNNNYLCFDKDGNYDPDCKGGKGAIGKVCNTFCNFPNSIKPFDSSTNGPEQCGGTTCVIDNVTFDEINSTQGSVSIRQVCNSSGDPPYLCYLGGINLDENKSSIGNFQISQDCQRCFLFDPDDPSKPAQEIDCNVSSPPPGPPIVSTSLFTFLKQNSNWVTVIVGILLMVLILFLFYTVFS